MNKAYLLSIFVFSACGTVNQGAQFAFTPDYYDPPNIYNSDSNNADYILVQNGEKRYFNEENEHVQGFMFGGEMSDVNFARVGHIYLSLADRFCQDRISDMYQAQAANDSGFGMLTTVSGIAGTALSSGNSANIASGFATFFNSVSSNAGAVQQQVNSVFTTNVISGIEQLRTEGRNGNDSREAFERDLEELVAEPGDQPAKQAQIRARIEQYNDYCTVGAGQSWVQKKVNTSEPAAEEK